ncbi:hypothetical protein WJX74_001398 [Apatococcus lobatus]|uniref:Secreted protein n=1 Tax=Apatococcus lobatus TaxID=904363 RepID=A0AAW1SF91_9CHLO
MLSADQLTFKRFALVSFRLCTLVLLQLPASWAPLQCFVFLGELQQRCTLVLLQLPASLVPSQSFAILGPPSMLLVLLAKFEPSGAVWE